MAFLVWVEFSDYGGQIKCCGRVLHTLIGRYVYGVNLVMFEMINTILALLAVVISLVALIRTRKVSEQQKVLTTQANRISALTTLLSEYKNRANLFETALNDGTVERENLNRIGMENAVEEYQEKQYQTLEQLEKELSGLK
ncbi:hypothetical protein [Vibrio marinisediminis]|uniref:hypothetical protein n=1 Tax=Vibrio marinisediminis TaxID=2758441 RepID=UPI0027B8C4BC|nr:hypothetical protein [Vibrio marinisediminis]